MAALLAAATVVVAAAPSADDYRLIQSLSGPSGKVDGAKFVFDQIRSRFVYPQDNSLIVYFEWQAPAGTHVLTGIWKRPDGQVDSISPDVKIESRGPLLTCYWTYILAADTMPGVWTLEVRIDGRPSGAHPFEIAGTMPPKPSVAPQRAPRPPTLDEVFRNDLPSLVWVRKLDASGRLSDTSSGFVFGKDRIVTALQAVDAAAGLQVEFAGGRKVETDKILAWSRSGDWAVVAVPTGEIPPVQPGDSNLVEVGKRLLFFDIEDGARVLGGVDISGKRNVKDFGDRIQFSPSVAVEAAGGPLLDPTGKVVGILGGSVRPGARYDSRHMSVNSALRVSANALNAATPVSALPDKLPDAASKLGDLVASGALSAPLFDMDGLVYVTTSLSMSKSAADPLPRDVGEFSRRDKQVWVVSEWQKKGKVSRGLLSAKVYDEQNRVCVTVPPSKVSLPSTFVRSNFSFDPGQLTAGIYRIDLIWDDRPVWRTFIRVTD